MAIAAFAATLVGLTALNVQVEPVNADAEHDGLDRSELRDDVESALAAAGIRIVSEPVLFAEVPGTPLLHLDVMTVRTDASYAYSVRLELWQAVRLVRDPGNQALAVTWSSLQHIGTVSADRLVDVRRVVRSVVDEFLEDAGYGAVSAEVGRSGGEEARKPQVGRALPERTEVGRREPASAVRSTGHARCTPRVLPEGEPP
jgi:hypothetical protein